MVHLPIVIMLIVRTLTHCGLAFVRELIIIKNLLEQSMTYYLFDGPFTNSELEDSNYKGANVKDDGDRHYKPHKIQLNHCQFDAINGPLMNAEDTNYEGLDIEGDDDKPAMPQVSSINHNGSQMALAANSVSNIYKEKRKRNFSMGRCQS